MLTEAFVNQICNEYQGSTFRGLAKDLTIHVETLRRVRNNDCQGHPYALTKINPSRRIPPLSFGAVQECCELIQKRKGM